MTPRKSTYTTEGVACQPRCTWRDVHGGVTRKLCIGSRRGAGRPINQLTGSWAPMQLRTYGENGKLRYSILSAFIGEMEAARFAGIMAAKKEQIASAPAASDRARGSHHATP